MSNAAAAPIGDEDIYAFNPVPPRPPKPAARRRVWPWVLAATLLVIVLTSLVGGTLLMGVFDGLREGVDIHIDGEDWSPGWVAVDHGFGALVAAAVVLLTLCVLLPLALLLALLGVALGLGLAAVAITAVLGLVLAPLWLPLLLLVWLLRWAAR